MKNTGKENRDNKDNRDNRDNKDNNDGKGKKDKNKNYNDAKSNKDLRENNDNYEFNMNTLESLNHKYHKVDVNDERGNIDKNLKYDSKKQDFKENIKKEKEKVNSEINSKNNNLSNKPKKTIPMINYRSFLDSKILFNEALNALSTEADPDNVAESILFCINEFSDDIYNSLDEKTKKKISKENFIAEHIDNDKFRESLFTYISEISYNVLDDIKHSLKDNLKQLKMEVKLNCYNSNFNEDELKIHCNVEEQVGDYKEKVQNNVTELDKLNTKLRLCKNEHFKFFKESTQSFFEEKNISIDKNTDFFNIYNIVTEVSEQDYNNNHLNQNQNLNLFDIEKNINMNMNDNIGNTDKVKSFDSKTLINTNIENQWLSTFKKIQESNTIEKNINSLIYKEKLEFKKLEEEIKLLEECEKMNEKYFNDERNSSEMFKILNNIYA